MKCNTWKLLLVFSALLMFAFTGELAAQPVVTVVASPDLIGAGETSTLSITVADTVQGYDEIYLRVTDGEGTIDPDTLTLTIANDTGTATTTFTAENWYGSNEITAYYDHEAGRTATGSDEIIVGPADSIVLDASSTDVDVNGSLSLTATVWDSVFLLENVPVTFSVVGAEGSCDPSLNATGDDGEATSTFNAGNRLETVQVIATCAGGAFADTVDIEVGHPTDITLAPDGRVIFYGDTVNLTAVLTE